MSDRAATAVSTEDGPRRGDPAAGSRDDDATVLTTEEPWAEAARVAQPGARAAVRRRAAVPRPIGPVGDLAYVFRVLVRLTEARRELAAVKRELDEERAGRDERVMTMARQAVADEDVSEPVVSRARERLSDLEERRSRRAGAAASAEAEIERLRADRTAEGQRAADTVAELSDELRTVEARVRPLEREAGRARRKAAELHVALERVGAKIAAEESGLGSRDGSESVEADLASLRAERESIAADEPGLAAKLDDLEPKIASLHATGKELRERIERIRADEREDQERTDEKIAAVRARKVVEDRAVSDADRERTRALRDLGESLTVERPEVLADRLAVIEEHDVSIATLERRAQDLHELFEGIDRAALVRGALMLLCGIGAVVAVALFVLL